MLRNFVQVLRSGVLGRKSLGTAPKRLVQRWLDGRTVAQLMNDAVGQSPSLADIIKMVHPRPVNLERVRLQFDYVVTHAEKGYIVCTGYTKHCAANSDGKPVGVDSKTVQLWQTFPDKI
jgi:hypothetical protein